MILVYDTETTGLPPRDKSNLKAMPRLVQLGAAIYSNEGVEMGAIDLLIRPDGAFEVPAQATAVHGIDTGMAQSFGLPLSTCLTLFLRLRQAAEIVVGHNVEYDEGVMDGEYFRINHLEKYSELCKVGKRLHCTAVICEPIIQLPPSEKMRRFGYGPFKKPNLQEAHEWAMQERFEGAHSALVDVRACARVYFHLRKNGYV